MKKIINNPDALPNILDFLKNYFEVLGWNQK